MTASNKPDVTVAFLLLLVLFGAFTIISRCQPAQNVFSSSYASFNAVTPGWSETQVKAFLGKPDREHVGRSIPLTWKVSGYVEPKRGITGKVLIYFKGDLVCYCFLDRKGIVEETFIGGS